tara:strand:- start:341 stop:1024 length:684 start_codon:yes stop_codon:yes gene_type:complete
MQAATAVNKSVAIGYRAMYAHTGTGDEFNVHVGADAGLAETTGYGNTFVGGEAGKSVTTGTHNTYIGKASGGGATTGNYNICLGREAAPSSTTAGNECTLGDSNINSLRCNDTSISSLSDRRDKTDIVDLPIGLNFLNTLRPVKFKWATRDGNVKDGKIRAGFIAQELQSAQTGSEYLDLVMDNNPDKLEAKQEHLIPVLVKAVQELSAKNEALAAEVEQLKSQLNN